MNYLDVLLISIVPSIVDVIESKIWKYLVRYKNVSSNQILLLQIREPFEIQQHLLIKHVSWCLWKLSVSIIFRLVKVIVICNVFKVFSNWYIHFNNCSKCFLEQGHRLKLMYSFKALVWWPLYKSPWINKRLFVAHALTTFV